MSSEGPNSANIDASSGNPRSHRFRVYCKIYATKRGLNKGLRAWGGLGKIAKVSSALSIPWADMLRIHMTKTQNGPCL